MSTLRGRVIRNSILNLTASVSQRIGYVLILIIIARLLSENEVGSFTLANTYTSVLLALSLWGLDQVLIRELARDRSLIAQYLPRYLSLRVMLAILLWLLLTLLLPLLAYSAPTERLILVMSLSIVPGAVINLYQSVWIAFEDVKIISLATLLFSAVRVLGGFLLLVSERPLTDVAVMILLVNFAEMAAVIWITHGQGVAERFRFAVDIPFWIDNIKIATPLIIVSFILIVEYQFDVIILSLFHPEEEVGIYGIALSVLTFLLFLSRSYQLAIFPVLSRAYHTDAVQLRSIYGKSVLYLLIGSIMIAVVVGSLSGQIIGIIYESAYDRAGEILSILVWAFVLSALNVPNSRLLLVANRQRVMASFAILSMSGNLLLSFWLVPRLGGVGTAMAKVMAMPLYTVPALLYVQRHICPIDWRGWRRIGMSRRKSTR